MNIAAKVAQSKDMRGQRVGILTVLEYAPSELVGAHWLCRCDCGETRVISGKNLRKGQYSCGCTSLGRRVHNQTDTPTYRVWIDMLRRCNDPKRDEYKNYGARGIAVCERWQKFENFFADMGARPDGHSIERVNNDLGYCPENCCWLPKCMQAKNRRNTRHVLVGNKKLCMADAARCFGIGATTLHYRLSAGWPENRLSEPVR